MENIIHSLDEKYLYLMELVNHYFKNRIENFDNYYLCTRKNVFYFMYNWILFFVSRDNDPTSENYFINEFNDKGE